MTKPMIGKKFGRLTCVKAVGRHATSGEIIYLFRCEDGNEVEIIGGRVRSGNSTSCGCFHRQRQREIPTTHGHATGGKPTPEYIVWQGMLARCGNPNSKIYKYYGGKGVRVCDRWRKSFANFFADMGSRPPGTSIERNDGSGNYEPGNCRWATDGEQARNMSNNVRVTHNGESKVLAEWERYFGFKKDTIGRRMRTSGMSFEEAISKPVNKGKSNGKK